MLSLERECLVSTTEQLTEIVERVRVATESLSGDELRLREIAFEKLLEHELSVQPNGHEPQAPQPGSRPKTEAPPDSSYATIDMRAEAVARYFKINPEEALDIFNLSEEAPSLDLPSPKLPSSKAQAVRQIALLIGGARTALGLQTGSADIRTEAELFDKVDGNFMAHLTSFDKIAVRGKRSSPNRLIRMRVIGAEEAQRIARGLVSNGE